MTYRNRVKKPNRHLKLPYWAKRLMVEDQEWFEQWCGKTGYKIGYMRRRGYTDTINPHTGKYHGWHEYGWKERGLKKRHRRAGKQLIASQLFDMEMEIQEQEKQISAENAQIKGKTVMYKIVRIVTDMSTMKLTDVVDYTFFGDLDHHIFTSSNGHKAIIHDKKMDNIQLIPYSDQRPDFPTDEFLAKLVEMPDIDDADVMTAITAWVHGDWGTALEFVKKELEVDPKQMGKIGDGLPE